MVFLYSSDRNYAKLSMISISSLLENNQDADSIKIYYINNNIGKDYQEQLSNLVHGFNRDIVYVDASLIDTSFITKTWFSVSGYYRVLITEIIQEPKIIYLDCDTVINGSFKKLWELELNDYLFGGVKDTVQNFVATAVGQKNNSYYINSGFLYINLEKCRRICFDKQVREYFDKFNGLIPHHDQGIVNAIGFNKILYLSPKYNLTSQYLNYSVRQLCRLFDIACLYEQKEVDEAILSPVVIHYLNYNYGRPWEKGCKHPYLGLFNQFKQKYNIDIVLKDSGDSKGTKFRKLIYRNCPFLIHLWIEKTLDITRKYRFSKTFNKL